MRAIHLFVVALACVALPAAGQTIIETRAAKIQELEAELLAKVIEYALSLDSLEANLRNEHSLGSPDPALLSELKGEIRTLREKKGLTELTLRELRGRWQNGPLHDQRLAKEWEQWTEQRRDALAAMERYRACDPMKRTDCPPASGFAAARAREMSAHANLTILDRLGVSAAVQQAEQVSRKVASPASPPAEARSAEEVAKPRSTVAPSSRANDGSPASRDTRHLKVNASEQPWP
jgi:hypothetical protein